MDQDYKLTLPTFLTLDYAQVLRDLDRQISQHQTCFEACLAQSEASWEKIMTPLQAQNGQLEDFWGVISHLHHVVNEDALRQVYETGVERLTQYYAQNAQNKEFYQKVLSIQAHDSSLDGTQKKILSDMVRGFRLSGVDLDVQKQQRYRALTTELAQLSSRFENNVLDATQHWSVTLTDAEEIAGLPMAIREVAAEKARSQGNEGWCITLDGPIYHAVISYADHRPLRRQIYEAYVTRASECGPSANQFDNGPVMVDILSKKNELANLVGFETIVGWSLATKMAENEAAIQSLLQDLVKKAQPLAIEQWQALQAFAKEQGCTQLAPWDVAYYSEKLRQQQFEFDREALRDYFPLTMVQQGLFSLVGRLFGLTIEPFDTQDTWHPDVQSFALYDQAGCPRGVCYFDLFARENKRQGAWLASHTTRYKRLDGRHQVPVAFLVCNFQVPAKDQVPTLNHDEIVTLFHEFGHCMHHLLSKVDYRDASGMSGVEWDAVELPSQLMENWAWQYDILATMSAHHVDGTPLPRDLFEKMQRARHFQSALFLLRQCEFALFDLAVHREVPHSPEGITTLLNRIRDQVAVIPTWPDNRFQNSFLHIFAGGYDAGYYSYLWAEVLSCDAFARFEEEGLDNPVVGKDLLATIFETGGAASMMTHFIAFRGRRPSIEPLLRHHNITGQESMDESI